MVIVCESCQTRFHLADGRIGPQGARVRCSSCHHRFHVVPPGASPAPAAHDDSAAASPDPPAPPESPPGPVGDPDLDNPEFLFDQDPGASTDTLPTGTAGIADPGISLSGEMTQMHDVDPDEPEPTLGDPDDDTPPPDGERPSTPVFGMDPDVSQRQQELSGGSAEPAADAFGGGRDMELDLDAGESGASTASAAEPLAVSVEPITGSGIEPAGGEGLPLADEPVPEPLAPGAELGASASELPNPGDIDDAIRSAFDDDEDPLSEWDPLADPGVAAAAERRGGPVRVVPAETATAAAGRVSSVGAPTDLEDDAVFDPAWVRVAAVIVGALLIAGAARQALHQHLPAPGPERVQGAGWIASDVSVEPARDAAGDKLWIVRGRLEGGGGAPPRVGARLIGPGDRPLEGDHPGVVLRRGDPAPQPAELERLLSARLRPARGQVVGFAIPLRTPDPRAERVRLLLSEGARDRFEARQEAPRVPPVEPEPAAELATPAAPASPE